MKGKVHPKRKILLILYLLTHLTFWLSYVKEDNLKNVLASHF